MTAPVIPKPNDPPASKVSSVDNSKDDTENVLRTPQHQPQSTVQQIANWFTKGAASKTYERVSASGKKFQSRKQLRMSSDEELSPSPKTNRVTTRRSKKAKESSFKHTTK